MSKTRVAVLGAGIMGSATAMFLARRNVHVTLFDELPHAMGAASRWNEGKIHLGFLYSAGGDLATARQVLPGGLSFRPLMEELLGINIGGMLTEGEDLYLCHKQSVVSAAEMEQYFGEVAALVSSDANARNYCVDVSNCAMTKLSSSELAQVSGSPDITAGFRVPERSVATSIVADKLNRALHAEVGIEAVFGQRVLSVSPIDSANADNCWNITTSDGQYGEYDYVVNALWQGRLAIDQGLDIALPQRWSHRYRQSLFVRTTKPAAHPNVVIATGPFGDIKNYNTRDFYLSWYPAGLRAESNEVAPQTPQLNPADDKAITQGVFEALQGYLPGIATLRENIESVVVAGGWVYAAADGSLADPNATVHARKDFGIGRRGTYFSVDTGKYSTAPWLALQLANQIKPR